MKKENDLAKYLESQFLSWQAQLGRRATVGEYADYLELGRTQLSQYMNGHTLPKEEVAARLAKKVGYEIYDVLNYERPDPLLIQFTELIKDPGNRNLLQEFLNLDSETRQAVLVYVKSRAISMGK